MSSNNYLCVIRHNIILLLLLTLPEHLSSPPLFSGVRVTRSLVLCVCFVDRCLSFVLIFGLLCCLSFDLQILITLSYVQYLIPTICSDLPRKQLISLDVHEQLILKLLEVSIFFFFKRVIIFNQQIIYSYLVVS